MELSWKSPKLLMAVAGALLIFPCSVSAQHYTQTNLVSDVMGNAPTHDPNLVNPWGLSRSNTSAWWVSDNATGDSTLYDGSGNIIPINGNGIVTIPAPKSAPAGTIGSPTGTVFNSANAFLLSNGKPAAFLFDSEDGTITGWNGGPSAEVVIDNSGKGSSNGAVYKGMTSAQWNGQHFLYVTNFHAGRVEVYDSSFKRVRLDADAFDPNEDNDRFDNRHGGADARFGERVPRGFAPFNIQNIGGSLFVTYAKQDSQGHDDVAGDGNGFVEIFTPGGKHIGSLEHGPWLNSPWGVVWTPRDFGVFSNTILVGNFGDGTIAAFNGFTHQFIGFVKNPDDSLLSIHGLWALAFGNNSGAGSSTTLFFTAGPQHEMHGLFGTLTPVATEQDGSVE
jgi:uncharacterized protein (TIGR03118 family)